MGFIILVPDQALVLFSRDQHHRMVHLYSSVSVPYWVIEGELVNLLLAMGSVKAALDRACAYVEAGANMIFPEAITELGQYRKVKDAVKVPILANLTEFGSTPLFTLDELRGVNVDIALYCCGAYRAMNAAALNFYKVLRREGTQKSVVPTMQTRAELYDYLGYHDYENKLDALFSQGKGK